MPGTVLVSGQIAWRDYSPALAKLTFQKRERKMNEYADTSHVR